MDKIVLRADLPGFKPTIGELYVVMRLPKDGLPRLHLSYYQRDGRMIRRRDLVLLMDYVASDFRMDRPGMDNKHFIERDPDILGIQKANANAILLFVRMWKDGPDDFFRFVEMWPDSELLERPEIERVSLIAHEEVRRQQLFG